MNKKIFIMPVLMCGLVSAAFANIDTNNESPECDVQTLGVESGPTKLEAVWRSNSIGISWYDGHTKLDPVNEGASECAYDEGITLPGNELYREGYTFAGWTARKQFDVNLFGTERFCLELNPEYNSSSSKIDGEPVTASTYGLTSPGEWGVTFVYGDIKGEASCNNTPGTSVCTINTYTYNNDGHAASDFTKSITGGNCWCRATELMGNAIPDSTSKWIFYKDYSDGASCANVCGLMCSERVRSNVEFRTVILGLEE